MRTTNLLCLATFAVSTTLAGCARPAAAPVSRGLAVAPPDHDVVAHRALLLEADHEIGRLRAVRASAAIPEVVELADRRIVEIAGDRDALLDDMAIADGSHHEREIRVDAATLERVLHPAAATEMQAPSETADGHPVDGDQRSCL